MSKAWVVITGASSGIGAAMAKGFSDAGYPVCLIARNMTPMEGLNLPNSLCISNAKFGVRICNLAPAKIKTPMLSSDA